MALLLRWFVVMLVVITFFVGKLLVASPPQKNSEQYFEDRVELVLERRCFRCHNEDAKKGELDLTTAAGLMAGGESGPILTLDDPMHSPLWEAIRSGTMPPEGEPLPAKDIAVIEGWLSSGAKFRKPLEATKTEPNQHDVLPILLLRCATCHGAELKRGGFEARTIESIFKGGDSGPALVPGDSASSRMIQRVEQQLCPPKSQLLDYFVRRPPAHELDLLRRWIDSGAHAGDEQADIATTDSDRLVIDDDRKHWAFQPLPATIEVPTFKDLDFAQPIDAFIYEQLSKNGLDFSPPAERSTLIRRVYFDLVGLPPTGDEWSRWNVNTDDRWYEAMIDELLKSPKYGERWGRYWLDVAGYADSEGGVSEDVVRALAWKYRDYVIRAHNQDKPWDRFLLEQLAGDELAEYRQSEKATEAVVDNLVATGFLRMGVDQTGSRTMNFVPERIGVISDALNVVSSGLMGLTMECARCHSHKYDPIPQRDYYRMKAIFQGAFDEHDWMSWKTRSLDAASPEIRSQHKLVNGGLEKEIKQLEATRKQAIKKRQDPYYEASWPKIADEEQKEILAALKLKADRRTVRQDELVLRHDTEIRPIESVLVKSHPDLVKELVSIDEKLGSLKESLLPAMTIRALWDRGRPSPTYILVRGEHDRPGRLVGPGVPSVLTDGQTPFKVEPPWPGAESTGRRLAFARWLTEKDHPLTARVFVNRVWKLHFGQGIVKTLDNFGALGSLPSHPELLDWLARDFIQGGWSLKSLHREILLSRTYRQSSDRTLQRDQIDPENRWLSQMNMQRLDAEAMRDSILSIAGRLDSKMLGPPAKVDVREDGLIMDRTSSNGMYRRSVYLQLRRTEMPSLLAAFDYPDMQPNCSQRTTSTVSPQSLMLSNNSRIYALASDLSERLIKDAAASITSHRPSEDDRQGLTDYIEMAYRLILSRLPIQDEIIESRQAIQTMCDQWQVTGCDRETAFQKALATFCHTIINSAEFLYVD